MKGWLDGFPFKSKAQMEEERMEYQKKVLPMGAQQREKALAIMQSTLTGKLNDEEKLYNFFVLKEKYMKSETRSSGIAAMQEQLRKSRWVTRQDGVVLMAFVILEVAVLSLEEYPTVQDVQREVERLENELA